MSLWWTSHLFDTLVFGNRSQPTLVGAGLRNKNVAGMLFEAGCLATNPDMCDVPVKSCSQPYPAQCAGSWKSIVQGGLFAIARAFVQAGAGLRNAPDAMSDTAWFALIERTVYDDLESGIQQVEGVAVACGAHAGAQAVSYLEAEARNAAYWDAVVESLVMILYTIQFPIIVSAARKRSALTVDSTQCTPNR